MFEVRDLWPEVPIQMGAIRNRLMQRFLRWFEKLTYKSAIHVNALSPGMQQGVIKYVPIEKTSMIPNMAKIDKFWPRTKNISMIKELGLNNGTFKVIYFGTMGLANAIPYVLDAIKIINRTHKKDIEFLFVGHGRFLKELDEIKGSENMNNIKTFTRKTMEEMSEILNFCDVSLVTFTNLPILYTNSPNKLFDTLSAGKPVIVNSSGWTKEMVETGGCGLYVDPKHSSDLAKNILYLKDNPEIVQEMGENARKLAENKYDKTILCKEFADIVNSISKQPKI